MAIETFRNNFILEFYLNLILLFDETLPVKKSLIPSFLRGGILSLLLFLFFFFLFLFFSFLTLFSMFFLPASKLPTKSFCAKFCSKGKNNLGYDCYKGFFWKIIIIIRPKKKVFGLGSPNLECLLLLQTNNSRITPKKNYYPIAKYG